MKSVKRLIGLLLALIVVAGTVPVSMLSVFAWDTEIDCEFCGAFCGDNYICDCGDHCSEESGRSCYEEHHCSECNEVGDICEGCGVCYDCAGECSAGQEHLCLQCHVDEDFACPDCGQCWLDEDTICKECLGCVDCIGRCEGGDHLLCIECHDEVDICPECDTCYIESDVNSCDSCYTCEYCVYICPECNLCENCVQICENCEEICVDCHEAEGDVCVECGFCYFGEIYCQDCGICYNCEYICPDCELCLECYGDYHCVECDECFEANGQCENGGDHCAACCENNDWLCPECGDCIEVSGATVCQDCGVCESCAEICGICGDFCIECAQFEELLHCVECGECFEGNALMHCADCYLCENCTEMCPECWDYCVDCGVKGEMHCPDCKGCYYIYDKCQSCGICSNCIDDYCDICHQCGDCAFENESHCVECGVCFELDGREYDTCWNCMKCSDCLGDEYCYTCGGCNTCIAIDTAHKNWYHCAECYRCFDSIEQCEGCEYCVDCCKCLFLSTVTFDANGGSGTMAPENVYGAYKLPSCEFSPPISRLPTLPPTIVRWMFIGWRIGDSIYNEGDIVIIDTDTTITAMWTQIQPLSYSVVYNGNGGSGTMEPEINVSGDFILPKCEYTAPAGKQFKAYYVNGVYYQPGDTINVQANTVVWVYWKAAPAGAVVSGTVTSYKSETADIILQLFKSGSTEPTYEIIVQGNSTDYRFDNVPNGTYTLCVTKEGHLTFETVITVDGKPVVKNVALYIDGDVNADGNVDVFDYMMVKSHYFKKYTLTDAEFARADLVKDGTIDVFDYMAVKKKCFNR